MREKKGNTKIRISRSLGKRKKSQYHKDRKGRQRKIQNNQEKKMKIRTSKLTKTKQKRKDKTRRKIKKIFKLTKGSFQNKKIG